MSRVLESNHGARVGADKITARASSQQHVEDTIVPMFTPLEISIVQAYWDGKQMKEIVMPDITSHTVRKTLLDPGKLSIKQRIFQSTGETWMPSGSGEITLWMYKHGVLPRLEIGMDTQINDVKPFSDTSIMIARLFLAGHTSSKQIRSLLNGRMSESEIRNVFNGSPYSIASTIYWWTEETYFPSHKLVACRWMVEHGIIPESVIGEALP